jgi:hypothetical protein
MARIGILTLYAIGHLNPSITLARALQAEGDDLVFFNVLDTKSAITSADGFADQRVLCRNHRPCSPPQCVSYIAFASFRNAMRLASRV